MNVETSIGLVAGLLTTAAFVPQVLQVWKSRSARDLSLPMYLIFTAGVALWLTYGLMTGAVPVIAANAVTLLLAGAVLVMKIRFG
jgi:MtN3 and saliva related transmembrane protein